MTVDDLRRKIDEIDINIIKLLAERVRLAEDMGREKKEQNSQIIDINREQVVLNNVINLARTEGLNQSDIANIYKQIIHMCRMVQGAEVAFQGEIGAYSEEAVFSYFGNDARLKPYETLDDVFRAVEDSVVNYAVVPIENSLEGSISRSYDLLLDSNVSVCGEIMLRITHCLIAMPGTELNSIKKIYSHPQALGQCQKFLKLLNCQLIPTYDTAGSVKMIKEENIIDGAAIASRRAAKVYGMSILASEIEDNKKNFTRFFVLAKIDTLPTGNDKTSIVFSTKHQPGQLHKALSEFARRGINLTKLESRPTKQNPWEYNFYLDFEGHYKDKIIQETLRAMEKTTLFLKILGSYPRAK